MIDYAFYNLICDDRFSYQSARIDDLGGLLHLWPLWPASGMQVLIRGVSDIVSTLKFQELD